MLHHLEKLDIRATLFLNGLHSPLFDGLMMWCTYALNWLPFYVLLLALLIKHYRRQTIIIILFTAVLITITDQVSLHLFKNMFMRLRPCSNPHIMNMVHIVNDYRSGAYSFTSSHATNFFGIAIFFIGLLGKKVKYFTPLILLFVSFIAYTRIYLGVHFVGDVIAGALVGSIIGYLMQLLYKYFSRSVLSKKAFFQLSESDNPF